MFSTVGSETLNELVKAWEQVDSYVHVNQFVDLSALESMVEETGFECTQCEREVRKMYYDNVLPLMQNLKDIGAHNVNTGQNKGLTSRSRIVNLEKAYHQFRDEDGRLPATWEIYYLVLRKPS